MLKFHKSCSQEQLLGTWGSYGFDLSFKTMKSMKMSAPAGKKYFFEEPLLVALNYVYEIIR